MSQISAVILAAGEGKRMKSRHSKVTHKACGRPLIKWVYEALHCAGTDNTIVVVGHKADEVKECMGDKVSYVLQEKQLGTGHAVMQAESFLSGKEGTVVVLCGDTPLITSTSIKEAIKHHVNTGNSATVITALLDNPTGYGRIIRNDAGNIVGIVEEKDATDEERSIKEINSGMYCFNISDLLASLKNLKNENSQGEYYLTDTIEILVKGSRNVGAYVLESSEEIMGVNDRIQLLEASSILKKRILQTHMQNGVTIIDPSSTFIDQEVQIGMDTIIYPSTIIEGRTIIGEGCIIGPGSKITSCCIEDSVEIVNSVLKESSVGEKTKVGPFAYLRPDSKIGKNVKIGDFVEIKKSQIGDDTKISHLSYVGDCEVGRNVNIGCGVVVVNYDGKKKHKTIIGDHSFVGSNSNLVSPVEIGENSFVAAGSTITDKVPDYSLAIARGRQVVKEDWVIKKGKQRK